LYTLNAVVLGHSLLILPLYMVFAFAALIDPRVVELLFMFPSARFSGLSF